MSLDAAPSSPPSACSSSVTSRATSPRWAVWPDTWERIGLIVTGTERQGFDVSLTRYPEGWRGTFLRRDHTSLPWVGQVLTFHLTPWAAVQHAAWSALSRDQDGAAA